MPEQASISRGRACEWKVLAFQAITINIASGVCYAIFIVVAERYGCRGEEIYPLGNLEVSIQARLSVAIEASGWDSRSFISYAFIETASGIARIRINRI